MRFIFLFITIFAFVKNGFSQSNKISFNTELGSFKVLLYDFTPYHRDLMLNSIKDSVYQNALFNRVIENYVVQGGEHDIDIAKRESNLPTSKRPRLAAEFDQRAFHKIGALGQGRDDNPGKASFLNQIYFVVATEKVSNSQLDELEKIKGIKYTEKQRQEYLTHGGLPKLDNDYTIFGEIYEGIDVILKISKVKTDEKDYPYHQIPFTIKVIE